MRDGTITHVGFADESNWNTGRFRSLGLVTTPIQKLGALNEQLKELIQQSGITEFKWRYLTGARERLVAQKLCKFVVEQGCEGILRVDVLIWDTRDRRHAVKGRDDIANLQRMYYHLFRNVLKLRWPDNPIWRLHPDEHTNIDWITIQNFLEVTSKRREFNFSLYSDAFLRPKQDFDILDIQPVNSREHPLLQVADLFAGIAVFSHDKFDEYQQWLRNKSNQLALPELELQNSADLSSRSTRERFEVLYQLVELCKAQSLQLSLKSHRGLRTMNPKRPINFWLYEPQHPRDKAPTRK